MILSVLGLIVIQTYSSKPLYQSLVSRKFSQYNNRQLDSRLFAHRLLYVRGTNPKSLNHKWFRFTIRSASLTTFPHKLFDHPPYPFPLLGSINLVILTMISASAHLCCLGSITNGMINGTTLTASSVSPIDLGYNEVDLV